eukprot:scaffold292174_cov17-Tisochrysis_lutea.AAC.1
MHTGMQDKFWTSKGLASPTFQRCLRRFPHLSGQVWIPAGRWVSAWRASRHWHRLLLQRAFKEPQCL